MLAEQRELERIEAAARVARGRLEMAARMTPDLGMQPLLTAEIVRLDAQILQLKLLMAMVTKMGG